jgi:myosin-6
LYQDDPDDNRGGCRVTAASEESLAVTAGLMGLDGDELRRALTARVMQATKAAVQLPVRFVLSFFKTFLSS